MAATIGKVSAVFSASTSGLRSGVNDAIASFRRLGGEAGTLKGLFDRLQATSALAGVGPAADKAASSLGRFQRLAQLAQESLAAGRITAEQFATKMNMIGEAAERAASTFARGATITQQFRTEEEQAAEKVQELNDLLAAGAITQQTYARAMAEATGESARLRQQADEQAKAAAEQARAADELARVMDRGAAFARQFETAEEQANRKIGEATELFNAGAISLDTYTRAINAATVDTAAMEAAAAAERAALEAAAKQMDALTATFSEGASVTQSVATAEEKHASEVQRLRGLLAAGAISQETYNRAVAKSENELKGTASASRGLGSATSAAAAGVGQLAGKLNTLIALNAAQLFGQIAGVVSRATSSFYGMAQGQAQTIDTTSKLSRRLGMTYGELAGLSLAGDLAGVSMETIGKAATKADVAFVKAAQGSKLAQGALAGVGLSVDELQNKSPAERFQMMADAIAGLPTPAERARASIALFGKSGADLLPLFEGGAGSIRAAVDEANKFGLALTDEQGVAVEGMNDAFTRAYASIQGVVQQVVAYLAPAIQSVTDTFTNLIGGIGGANIGQFIGEGIMAGAEFLAAIGDSLISGLSAAWEFVSNVAVQWASVFDIGNRVAAALSMVGNALKFVLAAGIAGLSVPIANFLKGADYLADRFGVDLGVDNWIAGADAFNNSLMGSMTEASQAMAADFNKAFGEGTTAAAAAQTGPLSTMLADARKAREEAAAAKNEAAKTTVTPTVGPAFSGTSSEALRATDSRSKEGLSEMFRLMRGKADEQQERIARATERTADAVSEPEESYDWEMAG